MYETMIYFLHYHLLKITIVPIQLEHCVFSALLDCVTRPYSMGLCSSSVVRRRPSSSVRIAITSVAYVWVSFKFY